MAKKTGTRLIHRESGIQNRRQDTLPDEIALRDEILDLKRQIMILKRTNEQYSVKLRKYEDESKRKDKQLEQLMDPRKNSDITKVLSTKGAAILMNLKDQNNTLIQIILNKDLHIRRLLAEIKMSKLYASTKKNERYRVEINRLRNLLIKSQQTLKDNVDFHQQAVCISGNSFLDSSSSSSSDQSSSPRDLDELRLTILSLESHIQQSNDLLFKKNQEISLLKEELNFLKKYSRCKTFKTRFHEDEFSSTSLQQDFMPTKLLTQDIINKEEEKLHQPEKWISSVDPTLKYTFHSEETTELIETNQENIERVNKGMGKSLFHHLATDEIKREEKILSNLKSTAHVREKWKKALNKYKEVKQLNPEMFSGSKQVYLECEYKENELQKVEENSSLELFIKEETATFDFSDNEASCQRIPNDTASVGERETPFDTQNIAEEIDTKYIQENNFRSLDSSFDSDEGGYSVKQVQVEVQINSVSSQSDNDQMENSILETNQCNQCERENDKNPTPEHDFNDDDDDDDDDVITRDK